MADAPTTPPHPPAAGPPGTGAPASSTPGPLGPPAVPPSSGPAPVPAAPGDAPSRSAAAPRWLGVVVVVVGAVLWGQLNSLHSQQRALSDQVDALARAVAATPPPMAVDPASGPSDAEAARQAIAHTYRVVFSPGTPAEEWAASIADPGDLAVRLTGLTGTQCAGALPVLELVRFTGPDHAIVDFHFEGVPIASGVQFQGGATRAGERWVMTPQTLDAVLDLAETACT